MQRRARHSARASSEPPPQAEEGAAAGEEEPRAPSAQTHLPEDEGKSSSASVAQADNANWANLSQALLEANASGTEKAEASGNSPRVGELADRGSRKQRARKEPA